MREEDPWLQSIVCTRSIPSSISIWCIGSQWVQYGIVFLYLNMFDLQEPRFCAGLFWIPKAKPEDDGFRHRLTMLASSSLGYDSILGLVPTQIPTIHFWGCHCNDMRSAKHAQGKESGIISALVSFVSGTTKFTTQARKAKGRKGPGTWIKPGEIRMVGAVNEWD